MMFLLAARLWQALMHLPHAALGATLAPVHRGGLFCMCGHWCTCARATGLFTLKLVTNEGGGANIRSIPLHSSSLAVHVCTQATGAREGGGGNATGAQGVSRARTDAAEPLQHAAEGTCQQGRRQGAHA